MSRHEGVSCDSCLVSNFRGRRYKCLICYDYDLCATCYEGGATSTRHSSDHPMQCILTRSDFELYYGGEGVSIELPHSFTCPFCKRMGLSDSNLLEHVTAEHADAALEVVCPVCAALPGGEPNMVTDDFSGHLTLEHRAGNARDLISFLDEPSAIRHGGVRRIPHGGRALGGPRSRRANMHFSGSGAGLSTLSPSGRESVDLIAELQQQLSSAPRRGGGPQYSQLQLLQAQVQMERNQQERRMERVTNIPRRQPPPQATASGSTLMGFNSHIASSANSAPGNSISTILSVMSFNGQRENYLSAGTGMPYLGGQPSPGNAASVGNIGSVGNVGSISDMLPPGLMSPTMRHQAKFLLGRMTRQLGEEERSQLEHDRVERSQFVQSLLLSTFSALTLDADTQAAQLDNDGAAAAAPSDNLNTTSLHTTSLTSSTSSSGSSHSSFKSAKSHKHTYKGSQKAPSYVRRSGAGNPPPVPKATASKHMDEAR